jgi:predicted flavoprotein YhiN
MNNHATGTFEVALKPQALFHETSPLLGRLSIDKTFHGDLAATSTGEMLSARTSVKDSAGYVAIERVSGTLHGHKGTFVLQHSSTMTKGEQKQSITVVPDSGTDELAGISGSMTIDIREGKHFYTLSYSLEEHG